MGLTPDMVDVISEADSRVERIYWVALTEAVASCAILGPQGNIRQIMSDEAIQELHRAANDDEQPIVFLQEFAYQTLVARLNMNSGTTALTADEIFRRSIDEFAPYKEVDERALQAIQAHQDDVWANQLATAARNIPTTA
jgi:hypothetical protein